MLIITQTLEIPTLMIATCVSFRVESLAQRFHRFVAMCFMVRLFYKVALTNHGKVRKKIYLKFMLISFNWLSKFTKTNLDSLNLANEGDLMNFDSLAIFSNHLLRSRYVSIILWFSRVRIESNHDVFLKTKIILNTLVTGPLSHSHMS